MTETTLNAPPLQGQCLCGAVTVEVTPPAAEVDACHCRMCQQWSGGALLTLRGVAMADVTLTGEENIGRYRSSEWAERAFCKRCGSNLWFNFIPGERYSFLAGLFEMPDDFAMHEQIFFDEKPEYYDYANDTPKKTGAEVIEEAKAAGFEFD